MSPPLALVIAGQVILAWDLDHFGVRRWRTSWDEAVLFARGLDLADARDRVGLS